MVAGYLTIPGRANYLLTFVPSRRKYLYKQLPAEADHMAGIPITLVVSLPPFDLS